MQTAFLSHPLCRKHEMGGHHPESPMRLAAIEEALIEANLLDFLPHFTAPAATREQLLRVHTVEYLERLERLAPSEGRVALDADTAMNPFTLPAALHAAGAGVLAVDLVLAGRVRNAFCSVRPPGHHALPGRAMGFCIFNNVAVAAAHALAAHGLSRVAIADFDVHHGNGSEAMFHADPRVLLLSTFQHPFYPHCGADSGNEHIVNVPLAAGSGGEAFRAAVERHWLPALERFAPELLLISAGFDGHRDDEMAQLRLVESDYRWISEQLLAVAARHCSGRIVSLLEGGYEPHALGRSALAHLKVLSGL